MRYRLRTLLILLAVLPPAIAVVWWANIDAGWILPDVLFLAGVLALLLLALTALAGLAVISLRLLKSRRPSDRST